MHTRLNRQLLLNVAGAAAVLFLSASLSSLAQRPGGGQGRARGANGANGPGAAFGGMMNTPMGAQMGEMLNKMRQTRAFVDPGVSNTSNLLTRSDVRNELVLNGRQTEAIAALSSGYPAAMMQGVMTTVISSMQKMQQDGVNMDFRTMTPDDRQQMFTQMRDKATESMFAVQADQDKKAEASLTPAQLKRLHELDLQWRGPLALTEEKLADKVNLTSEQRAKFTALLKELRDARMKAQMGMFSPGGGFPGAPGAGGRGAANAGKPNGAGVTKDANPPAKTGDAGAPNGAGTPPAKPATPGADPNAEINAALNAPGAGNFTPPSPEQIQRATDEASKQSEALLKAMDKKGLLLLTPEQQAQWKLLQGKPFTFRQYL